MAISRGCVKPAFRTRRARHTHCFGSATMRTPMRWICGILASGVAWACSGASASLSSPPCGATTCSDSEVCCNVVDSAGSCAPYCLQGASCPSVTCAPAPDCGCSAGMSCCNEATPDGDCTEICVAGNACPASSCVERQDSGAPDASPMPDTGPDTEPDSRDCPQTCVPGDACSVPELNCNCAFGYVACDCEEGVSGSTVHVWECFMGGL
jgi:hypothetical protein